MEVNDEILDLFLDSSPMEFFDLIKSDQELSYLLKFKRFNKFCVSIIRQGYYTELINFLNFVLEQENIFDCSIELLCKRILVLLTDCYVNIGEFQQIINISNEIQDRFPDSDTIKLSVLNGKALASSKLHAFNSAFLYLFEAIDIILNSENRKDHELSLLIFLTNIGSFYKQIDQIDSAIWYYEQANRIIDQLDKSSFDKTELTINLSSCLEKQGKYETAMNLVDENLNKYKSKQINFNLIRYKSLRIRKAKLLLLIGQIEKAKEIIDDFIPINKNTEERVKIEALNCYLNFLFINIEYDLFIYYFKKNHAFLLEIALRADSLVIEILEKAYIVQSKFKDENLLYTLEELKQKLPNKTFISKEIMNKRISIPAL